MVRDMLRASVTYEHTEFFGLLNPTPSFANLHAGAPLSLSSMYERNTLRASITHARTYFVTVMQHKALPICTLARPSGFDECMIRKMLRASTMHKIHSHILIQIQLAVFFNLHAGAPLLFQLLHDAQHAARQHKKKQNSANLHAGEPLASPIRRIHTYTHRQTNKHTCHVR